MSGYSPPIEVNPSGVVQNLISFILFKSHKFRLHRRRAMPETLEVPESVNTADTPDLFIS
jgi:hypothetical protein